MSNSIPSLYATPPTTPLLDGSTEPTLRGLPYLNCIETASPEQTAPRNFWEDRQVASIGDEKKVSTSPISPKEKTTNVDREQKTPSRTLLEQGVVYSFANLPEPYVLDFSLMQEDFYEGELVIEKLSKDTFTVSKVITRNDFEVICTNPLHGPSIFDPISLYKIPKGWIEQPARPIESKSNEPPRSLEKEITYIDLEEEKEPVPTLLEEGVLYSGTTLADITSIAAAVYLTESYGADDFYEGEFVLQETSRRQFSVSRIVAINGNDITCLNPFQGGSLVDVKSIFKIREACIHQPSKPLKNKEEAPATTSIKTSPTNFIEGLDKLLSHSHSYPRAEIAELLNDPINLRDRTFKDFEPVLELIDNDCFSIACIIETLGDCYRIDKMNGVICHKSILYKIPASILAEAAGDAPFFRKNFLRYASCKKSAPPKDPFIIDLEEHITKIEISLAEIDRVTQKFKYIASCGDITVPNSWHLVHGNGRGKYPSFTDHMLVWVRHSDRWVCRQVKQVKARTVEVYTVNKQTSTIARNRILPVKTKTPWSQ